MAGRCRLPRTAQRPLARSAPTRRFIPPSPLLDALLIKGPLMLASADLLINLSVLVVSAAASALILFLLVLRSGQPDGKR